MGQLVIHDHPYFQLLVYPLHVFGLVQLALFEVVPGHGSGANVGWEPFSRQR